MDWSKTKDEPQRRDPPQPPRIATLFRVVGAGGTPIRCATYRMIRTELFKPQPRQDERIAERAAEWRGRLDGHGFTDLEISE